MTATAPIEYVSPEWLSAAETAKLVRVALKAAFPGTKFSVRSSTYSGGASVDVSWTDGPTGDAVDRVAGPFAGADFDGMVDLKIHNQHWLLPDGTVAFAKAGGGGSTIPETIGDPPAPNARLVRFGADFVQTHRTVSAEWEAELAAEIVAYTGEAFAPNTSYPVAAWKDTDSEQGGAGLAIDNHRGEYGSTLIWQLAAQRARGAECEHGRHGRYYNVGRIARCCGCGGRLTILETA